MKDEHRIVEQVNAARKDRAAADSLIREYMPFIKSETARFMGRSPVEGEDDELSIAMIAFHEAIVSYSADRGAFLRFAAMLIKSRLIDFSRKEQRHKTVISLDTPSDDEGGTIGETIADERDYQDEVVTREATRKEIEELTAEMAKFGVSLTDVAENCPKQDRTLNACKRALKYAIDNHEIMKDFLASGKLPISSLAAGSGVEKKTLERHRKYMVALMLIYTNGFEIIRGHLRHMAEGVSAK